MTDFIIPENGSPDNHTRVRCVECRRTYRFSEFDPALRCLNKRDGVRCGGELEPVVARLDRQLDARQRQQQALARAATERRRQ